MFGYQKKTKVETKQDSKQLYKNKEEARKKYYKGESKQVIHFPLLNFEEYVEDPYDKFTSNPVHNSNVFLNILKEELNVHSLLSTYQDSVIIREVENICNMSRNDFHLESEIKDVLYRDSNVLKYKNNIEKYNFEVFVFLVNGIYSGHVYTWISNNIVFVLGIRSSMFQYLARKCYMNVSGIGQLIFDSIENFYKGYTIAVIQPIGNMNIILNSRGYKKYTYSEHEIDVETNPVVMAIYEPVLYVK